MLDALEANLLQLDVSVKTLQRELARVRWLAYAVCGMLAVMTIAAIALLCVVVAANVPRTHRVGFQGLQHEVWCERLIGQEVSDDIAGLGNCPDCIRGG